MSELLDKEERLKEEIHNKIIDYYNLKHKEKEFIPNSSKVNYAGRVYDENEIIALVDSALDFWLTAGKYASEFEEKFAEYIGSKHCLLTNSGSSANLLAISSLTSPKLGSRKLRKGDEIITTSCGFPTTLNPIIQNGLNPVFIDVKLSNYNIDVSKIEEAITDKTKAIFIAHTLGNPADIDKIIEIVEANNLWFIEDNCDALGSKYNGKFTGSFGHISTFSFYPAHHITMGEGGAVLTDDNLLAKIIASFRDWGKDCWCQPGANDLCKKRFSQQFGDLPYGYDHKYVYSHIGYNLKVTDMQAAIGVEQLKKLDAFINARKNNYKKLYIELERYEDVLLLPLPSKNSDPSWFGFPLMIKENAPFTRNELVTFLEYKKIETRMLFGGNLIKQPAYQKIKYRLTDKLENTNRVMNELFWIGVYPGLDEKRMNHIIKSFHEFFDLNL